MSELPPNESSIGEADAAAPTAVGHEARGAKTFPLTLTPVTLTPAAASTAANDNFVDRTIALWRRRLGREVSCEDARQITESVTGFFSVLHTWSRGETLAAANENKQAAAGEKSHDR
jgi:hypothetical protein